jgi:hypothetical protein
MKQYLDSYIFYGEKRMNERKKEEEEMNLKRFISLLLHNMFQLNLFIR